MIDPYVINDQNLLQKVRQIKNRNGLNGWINPRKYSERRRLEIKQELANLLLQDFISIPQIIQDENCSENLRDWATRIQKCANMIFYYTRFAKYLRTGTILELNEECQAMGCPFSSHFLSGYVVSP
jgi:hypothetical protein